MTTTINKSTLHTHAVQLIEASIAENGAVVNRILSHYRDAQSFVQLIGAFVGITRGVLELVFDDEQQARDLLLEIERNIRLQDDDDAPTIENGEVVQ